MVDLYIASLMNTAAKNERSQHGPQFFRSSDFQKRPQSYRSAIMVKSTVCLMPSQATSMNKCPLLTGTYLLKDRLTILGKHFFQPFCTLFSPLFWVCQLPFHLRGHCNPQARPTFVHTKESHHSLPIQQRFKFPRFPETQCDNGRLHIFADLDDFLYRRFFVQRLFSNVGFFDRTSDRILEERCNHQTGSPKMTQIPY
mmetsp:Transcript_1941/g.12205  ORF Transcript_1941/g.12205 Transcript_1941/m.12205 type:complete len:198 (+) Transcript_1941:1092-1685(+)